MRARLGAMAKKLVGEAFAEEAIILQTP